jgi:hypothetical protein
MKRKISLVLMSGLLSFILIYSCSKSSSTKKSDSPLEVRVDRSIALNDGADPCLDHGGGVGIGYSWQVATCKSSCERGIGFRCGSQGYVTCADGSRFYVGRLHSKCPPVTATRAMDADVSFLDRQRMKIIFQRPVPDSEIGNTNFEIEADEELELPKFITIDGEHFSGYQIITGVYQVDYNDGDFGSVVIPIRLIP